MASRLHLIPRFRRRLQYVAFGQGRPIWVDDPHFDIAYHVRLTALPSPGNREQLLTLCSRVQAGLLDRTRPLWELWFVEGLEGGHVGLVQKTHHALVDGVSGVDVATVLLDFSPDPPATQVPEWNPSRRRPARTCWSIDRPLGAGDAGRGAGRWVRDPAPAARGRRAASWPVVTTNPRPPRRRPHTSLNAHVGRNRASNLRVRLDDVKNVPLDGGTVNDVVLRG